MSSAHQYVKSHCSSNCCVLFVKLNVKVIVESGWGNRDRDNLSNVPTTSSYTCNANQVSEISLHHPRLFFYEVKNSTSLFSLIKPDRLTETDYIVVL